MTDQWQKRDRVYKSYQKWLYNALDDIINTSIVGGDPDKRLAYFSMFHLQVQLRNEHYASSRPTREDIDCISEKLFCKGVDSRIMEEVFPPSYNDKDGSEWPDTGGGLPGGPGGPIGPGIDGVDHMEISGDGTQHPINRIR